MSQAKISYFSLSALQGKEAKLDWIAGTSFEAIKFENINPDAKGNWINLTDNDFDSFLPLVDKEVKAGRSDEAVFKLFSTGVQTKKDDWSYSFSKIELIEKVKYFIETYQECLEKGKTENLDIKWDHDLVRYLERKISIIFEDSKVVESLYRPYVKQFLYFDKYFNARTFQMFHVFPNKGTDNKLIGFMAQSTDKPFAVISSKLIPDLNCISAASGGTHCLPLYRYDENGDRVENITNWALERFREHYLSTQARGLSPLFLSDPSSQEARGLSPLLPPVEDRQLWFVTFVTHNSRISERMVTYGVQVDEPLIFTDEDQIFIAEKIAEASKRHEIEIAAFNVLPDHVHMVIAAETEKELNENIRKIKGFSSHEFQRSRNFDKGQNIWAQKFNRQPIQDEDALTNILDYVLNNHIKHSERWGQELISTWGNGLPEKGLRPISEIVQNCITFRTRGLSPLPETTEREITKLDIFHYTYAVLHHPAYRTKYELNLKREFPRLPFYGDFHQWAAWGKALMDLHLNYEAIEPYGLQRIEIATKDNPKAKLKADKTNGTIILDDNTQLIGVEAIAWEYKLGNRSALEWILDQYKEKKPKDPTIAELFNTYKFADYKEQVIDLLQRVCTVSVKTMAIIHQMSAESS